MSHESGRLALALLLFGTLAAAQEPTPPEQKADPKETIWVLTYTKGGG